MSVVLLTGTSSGFGRIAAALLADEGHAVYATMRKVTTTHADVAGELAEHPNITVLEAEASDRASIEAAVQTVVDNEQRIDVLINNAGFFALGVGESFTDDDLAHIYNVNVLGPWRFIRAALPHMRAQGSGLIITVSSSLARFSSPFMVAYASVKHALEGLLEGLKYEIKPFGIDLALIEPGIYPTNVFKHSITGSDVDRNQAYGPFADIADQMRAQLAAQFDSGQANDPALVPQRMSELMELSFGQRPLRNPVDPQASEFTLRANAAQETEYANFLRASGMGELLE